MRILLVEDEPDLGAAIQRILRREKYVVDWVQNGLEAQNYLEQKWIDYTVAIFDWMVPGLSGVELCRRLRHQNSALPVLILTAKDQIEARVVGLDAGADDYLVKPFAMAEFLARVRALQRRSPHIQPPELRAGNLVLNYGQRTVCALGDRGSVLIELTTKEFQILEFLMRHAGQIITGEQLLAQLWEVGAEPSSNVVAAQMRLLRRRLAPIGGHALVETVHGLGYRFKKYDTES